VAVLLSVWIGGCELMRYVCSVCGYVYDPEQGDPESDINPGTLFEEIPDDWVCPICGVSKDQFEKMD
jgi:rubredoxin